MCMCQEIKCERCGDCCSLIPVFDKERERIDAYLKENPEIEEFAKSQPFSDKCIFYHLGKCLIYQVRPDICQAFSCKDANWLDRYIPIFEENGYKMDKNLTLINEVYGSSLYTHMYKVVKYDLYEYLKEED